MSFMKRTHLSSSDIIQSLFANITDVKDKQALTFFEAFTGSAKQVHQIPRSGYMSALLSVIPLQRLAYDLTIALGFDPDRPRNLAKELTTK
jgi:glucosamine 6-phosphate synthetase-like amidotransferase/phosphosugar isomerase protein